MQIKSEGSLQNSLLLKKTILFVLVKISPDRMRLRHMMKGNLLTQNSPIEMLISPEHIFHIHM